MFKFTIRELLLLTLVVALGVAWGLREWQLSSNLWMVRAGLLKGIVEDYDFKVTWDGMGVKVKTPRGTHSSHRETHY